MIRVVLDTNVFLSAVLNPNGKPARILELVFEDRIMLFVSELILEEIRTVFYYPKITRILKKKDIPLKMIEAFLERLEYLPCVPGVLKITHIKEDPDDDKFLSCALEAGADYIISGDQHLLDLGNYQGIEMVNAYEFLIALERKE